MRLGMMRGSGRDSLLVLILARRFIDRRWSSLDAAGRDAKAREILRAFFMPTRFSSAETRAAAEKAAEEMNVPFAVVSIDEEYFIIHMLGLKLVKQSLQTGDGGACDVMQVKDEHDEEQGEQGLLDRPRDPIARREERRRPDAGSRGA